MKVYVLNTARLIGRSVMFLLLLLFVLNTLLCAAGAVVMLCFGEWQMTISLACIAFVFSDGVREITN